jgi:hypothetical protein
LGNPFPKRGVKVGSAFKAARVRNEEAAAPELGILSLVTIDPDLPHPNSPGVSVRSPEGGSRPTTI